MHIYICIYIYVMYLQISVYFWQLFIGYILSNIYILLAVCLFQMATCIFQVLTDIILNRSFSIPPFT